MIRTIASVGLLALVVGCGSGDPVGVPDPQAASSGEQGPAKATSQFMALLKQGDIKSAEQMLTVASLKKLQSTAQGFVDPGFSQGKFEIGETRLISDSEAVVQCFVSEQTGSQAEICWCLKQESGGWRICGFLAQDASMPAPISWNFETEAGPQMDVPPSSQPPAQSQGPAVSTAQNPAAPATGTQ